MYRMHTTVSGEVVEVHQPIHEREQKTLSNLHNMKAWAEMNMLKTEMEDLFCEPFLETTWILSNDFPLRKEWESFRQNSAHSFGNMLKINSINASMESLPSYLHLYLARDYDDNDEFSVTKYPG
ncbi:hypothetical protein Pint_05657 [Pistacia integerrima]|uniref:Uncharacterized protein n=1 Tax=Pistacia integerrima TaxID=434235 RepID=A0ACC0Z6X3_9ROSI|nr:hypothetical protein Pint_05657 [Pistacia integerrima]